MANTRGKGAIIENEDKLNMEKILQIIEKKWIP